MQRLHDMFRLKLLSIALLCVFVHLFMYIFLSTEVRRTGKKTPVQVNTGNSLQVLQVCKNSVTRRDFQSLCVASEHRGNQYTGCLHQNNKEITNKT